jgi:hypothetical protein
MFAWQCFMIYQINLPSINHSWLCYLGYVPIHTPGFIFGSRYKESTEEALGTFLQTNQKQRSDQRDLAHMAATAPTLRKRFDFQDPVVYPDLNPMYSKNYRTCESFFCFL